MGLEEVLFNLRNSIIDKKSRIGNKLKRLENIIGEKVGIDGIKNKLGSLEERMEDLKMAVHIMPYALMAALSSNTYGRIGYYGSMAFISGLEAEGIHIAKGNVDAVNLIEGMYGKTPYVVGAITGVAGLIMGILLGDISGLYNLFHHNTDTGIPQSCHIPQLSHNDTNPSIVTNYSNSTIYKDDNITTIYKDYNITIIITSNPSSVTNYSNSTYSNSTAYIQNLIKEISNLKHIINQDNQIITSLENKLQNDTITINTFENQYNQTISYFQASQNLFGNSSADITTIQANSVSINNGMVYLKGTAYLSGANVTLGIPMQYLENNRTNIIDFYDALQKYGWNLDIVLDRADLQYFTLSNQNGTTVIDIQPNEPLNIGIIGTPVNASVINYAFNHLGAYTMLFQNGNKNGYSVYGSSNAVWDYITSASQSRGGSIIINFSNSNQFKEAITAVKIADQTIGSSNNQNPTSTGYIYVISIFKGAVNQNSPQYNVGNVYIPIVELVPEQGNAMPYPNSG